VNMPHRRAPRSLAAALLVISLAPFGGDQVRGEAEETEARQSRMNAELEALSQSTGASNARLQARVRALYRISRAGLLPLAGGFPALLAHVARVERLERQVLRDVAAMNGLRQRSTALSAEVQELARRLEHQRANADALEIQKRALEGQMAQAGLSGIPLAGAMESQTGGARGFDATWDPATGYGLRVLEPRSGSGAESSAAAGFEALRGQLALPLSAPRAIRDSVREQDGQGLELDGTHGAAVRTAAAGRVAFSDRHPGYGRLVIVEHGNNYFTIYGGLGRVDVETGDRLSRGMQLGLVEGEPLFFQVRRGTRALDARTWLGL
jgi:murein hydrolase activator